MKFSFLPCVLTIASLLTGCSYTKDLETLTPKQALQDLNTVSKNLREMHVDPWHTISEADFTASEEKLRQAIQARDSISRRRFALQIAKLMSSVGDDHTRLNLYHPYSKHLLSGGRVFPFHLMPQGEDTIITNLAESYQKKYPKLVEGHQLLAINGHPLPSFIDEVSDYVSDPTKALKRLHIINQFPIMAWYYWGAPDRYNLTLKKPDGETYQVNILSGSYTPKSTAQPKSKSVSKPKAELFEHVFYDDKKICVLHANTFSAPSYTDSGQFLQRWREKLDRMFKQMRQRNTEILIVDLRQNGGGNGALGNNLLRRITPKTAKSGTKHWRYSEAYRKNMLRYGLNDLGIPPWLMLEHVLSLHHFRNVPNPKNFKSEYIDSTGKIHPVANPWPGQFILLTGPNTGSAAVDLASTAKDNQLGLIFGAETGGRATYYSEIGPTLLPNSGLQPVFATARWTRPAGFDDGRGVLPDYPLDPSLSDEQMVQHIKQILETKSKTAE